jgi:hypothetical protein
MRQCAQVPRFKYSTDMFSTRQVDFDSPPRASHSCARFSGAPQRLEPDSLAIPAIANGVHKCAIGATSHFQEMHHWQPCTVQGALEVCHMHAPSGGPAMR